LLVGFAVGLAPMAEFRQGNHIHLVLIGPLPYTSSLVPRRQLPLDLLQGTAAIPFGCQDALRFIEVKELCRLGVEFSRLRRQRRGVETKQFAAWVTKLHRTSRLAEL